MKKQFAIQSAQVVKNVKNLTAKQESSNALKLLNFEKCCTDMLLNFTAKPVFSL